MFLANLDFACSNNRFDTIDILPAAGRYWSVQARDFLIGLMGFVPFGFNNGTIARAEESGPPKAQNPTAAEAAMPLLANSKESYTVTPSLMIEYVGEFREHHFDGEFGKLTLTYFSGSSSPADHRRIIPYSGGFRGGRFYTGIGEKAAKYEDKEVLSIFDIFAFVFPLLF